MGTRSGASAVSSANRTAKAAENRMKKGRIKLGWEPVSRALRIQMNSRRPGAASGRVPAQAGLRTRSNMGVGDPADGSSQMPGQLAELKRRDAQVPHPQQCTHISTTKYKGNNSAFVTRFVTSRDEQRRIPRNALRNHFRRLTRAVRRKRRLPPASCGLDRGFSASSTGIA